MNVPNKTKGFTIIEVVLVLAIAGLIFLVVFLALPALQRGQRDTQRKTDLGKLMSQVTAYQSNNQGNMPGTWSTFISSYMTVGGQSFSDPDGTAYSITASGTLPTATVAPTFSAGEIKIFTGAKCSTANASGVEANSGARNIAALIKQEQGGFYCQAN
jgi:prepilin-type N-terminal cleavage/methylation domain-containing protein